MFPLVPARVAFARSPVREPVPPASIGPGTIFLTCGCCATVLTAFRPFAIADERRVGPADLLARWRLDDIQCAVAATGEHPRNDGVRVLAIAVGLLVDARVGDAVELVVDLRARLAEGLPGAGGVDGVGSLPAELVGDAPGEVAELDLGQLLVGLGTGGHGRLADDLVLVEHREPGAVCLELDDDGVSVGGVAGETVVPGLRSGVPHRRQFITNGGT